MRSYLLGFIAISALACTQPAPKNKDKNKPTPASVASPETKQANATSEPTSTETPSEDPKDKLKLTVAASAPIKEPTPITPQKTDPECEVQGAALSDLDKEALFTAYIQIQKEYLEREKGVKNFKLTK